MTLSGQYIDVNFTIVNILHTHCITIAMHHTSAFVAVLAIANVFNIPVVGAKKVLRLPFAKSALDAHESASSSSDNSARNHKRTSIQARLGNQVRSIYGLLSLLYMLRFWQTIYGQL